MPLTPCPRINEVAVEVIGSTTNGTTSRIYTNQMAIEVLGTGCQHTNQVAVEVLGNTGTKQIVYIPPSSSSSLLITPYLRQGRVNQMRVEVLGNTSGGQPLRVAGNVNQMAIECLGPNNIGVPMRVNQMRVEVLGPSPENFLPTPGNVNQVAVEVLGKILASTYTNQVAVEILGITPQVVGWRSNQVAIEVLGAPLECYVFELAWTGSGTLYLFGSIYVDDQIFLENGDDFALEDNSGLLEEEGSSFNYFGSGSAYIFGSAFSHDLQLDDGTGLLYEDDNSGPLVVESDGVWDLEDSTTLLALEDNSGLAEEEF